MIAKLRNFSPTLLLKHLYSAKKTCSMTKHFLYTTTEIPTIQIKRLDFFKTLLDKPARRENSTLLGPCKTRKQTPNAHAHRYPPRRVWDSTHPAPPGRSSARTPVPGPGSADNWPSPHCSGPRQTKTPAAAVGSPARLTRSQP